MNLDEFVTQSKIQHLRRELRANPSNAEVKVVLATLLWRGTTSSSSSSGNESRSKIKARREESLSLFEEAHRLNPLCAETCNELALKYKATGKLDKAKEMFRKSLLVSNGTFCRAFRNLAILAKEEGDVTKSKEYLVRAVEADPNDTASWFNLGRMIFDSLAATKTNNDDTDDDDDEEVALSAIHSSLSCDPYNYAALLWLGRFYSKKYLASEEMKAKNIQRSNNNNNINNNNQSGDASLVLVAPPPPPVAGAASATHHTHTSSLAPLSIKSRLANAASIARSGEYLLRARQYFLQALHAHPFEAECYDAFGDYLASCVEDIPSAIKSYRHALGCIATLRSAQQKQIQEKILGHVGKMKERFDELYLQHHLDSPSEQQEQQQQQQQQLSPSPITSSSTTTPSPTNVKEDYDSQNPIGGENNDHDNEDNKKSEHMMMKKKNKKHHQKQRIIFNPDILSKKFQSEFLSPIPVPAMLHFTAVEKRPNPFCFLLADEKVATGRTIDLHDSLENFLAVEITKTSSSSSKKKHSSPSSLTKTHHYPLLSGEEERNVNSKKKQLQQITMTDENNNTHSQEKQQHQQLIRYWSSSTLVRCALGHQMYLVRTKPYFGFNAWSCDSCSKTISPSDAEKHGTYHCPLPCDCDICPNCYTRWTKGIRVAHEFSNEIRKLFLESSSSSSSSSEDQLAWFAEGGHIGFWNEKKRTIRYFHPVPSPSSSSSSSFILPSEKFNTNNSQGRKCLLVPTSIVAVSDERQIDFLKTHCATTSSSSSSSSADGFLCLTYQLPPNVIPFFSLVDRVYGDYPLQRGLHEFEVRAIMFHLLQSLYALQEQDFALGSICPSTCFVQVDSTSASGNSSSSSSSANYHHFTSSSSSTMKMKVTGVQFLAATGLHKTSAFSDSNSHRFPILFGTRNAHTFIAPEALPGRFEKRQESHRSTLQQMLVTPQTATTTTTTTTTNNNNNNNQQQQFPSFSAAANAASSSSSNNNNNNNFLHHQQQFLSPLQYSDMWSVSCIWLYLLSGTRPYKSLNSLTVRGYSRDHLPTIPFVISTFLSTYKIGRSPFNLERLKTILSKAMWNLIFATTTTTTTTTTGNNNNNNNSTRGKELFGVSSTTRWTPAELLQQDYFAPLVSIAAAQQQNQQNQSSNPFDITPDTIFCPLPPTTMNLPHQNVTNNNNSTAASQMKMESPSDYHFRTKFRFDDLDGWYRDPPPLEEAISTLSNHAFWADSPPVNVAWLVVAHALDTIPQQQQQQPNEQLQESSTTSFVDIRLPPPGSCIHEEIIAGKVIEDGKFLRVTKLDCLRYALGRGNNNISHALSWKSSTRQQKKMKDNSTMGSGSHLANVELFIEPSAKENLRQQQKSRGSFDMNNSSIAPVKTTNWTNQNNSNNTINGDDDEEINDNDNNNTTIKHHQLQLLFANRNDAVDIVFGVQKLLKLRRYEEKLEKKKTRNSSSLLSLQVTNLDVSHSHGMILEFDEVTQQQRQQGRRRQLMSLRDLVHFTGPISETLIRSFFAREILKLMLVDEDDDITAPEENYDNNNKKKSNRKNQVQKENSNQDAESDDGSSSSSSDDDYHDFDKNGDFHIIKFLDKKLHKKNLSPDSIFCEVSSSDTLPTLITLHLENGLHCLTPFAAATPLLAFDFQRSDFREKLSTMEQSDSIFHFAILLSWLLLGGVVDTIAEDAFNAGWVTALGNVFLNRDENESIIHRGISPDLLNLLQVCVSDVSTRKPSVREVMNQFFQQQPEVDDDEFNNNNNDNNSSLDTNNNTDIVVSLPKFDLWSKFEEKVKKEVASEFEAQQPKKQQKKKDSNSATNGDDNVVVEDEEQLQHEIQLRKQQLIKKYSSHYQRESISLKQWIKFWSDSAHRIRVAPQIFSDSKHFKNISSSALRASSSSATSTLLEWFIHPGDEFDKVCMAVEGYGDTLAITTLLMLSNFGAMSPHRLWLSNPDDIRFLVKKAALVAESGKKSGKAAATAAAASSSKQKKKNGSNKNNNQQDQDQEETEQQQKQNFSMIRFFQESSETSPDDLLHTLTKYGGLDASGKRFIFIRDNDLKVVTPSNKLGCFEQFDTSKKWTYYHRLRFGRAIENYLFPFYGPLALLYRDPKVTFSLTLASWATFSLQFFPAFILPSLLQSIISNNSTTTTNKKSSSSSSDQQQQQQNQLVLPASSSGFFPGRCGEAWIGWQDSSSSNDSSPSSSSSNASSPAGGSGQTAVVFSQQTVKKACKTEFDADLYGMLYHRLFRGNFYDLKKSEIDNLLGSKDSKRKMQQMFHPMLNEFDELFPVEYYDDSSASSKNSSNNNNNTKKCILLDDLQELYINQRETKEKKSLSLIEIAKLVNPPNDKTTGQPLGDPLIWPQLPQFLNYLTSLLTYDSLIFQALSGNNINNNNNNTKDIITIDDFTQSFFKELIVKQEQEKSSSSKATSAAPKKGAKIQLTLEQQARKRLLPPLLRKAIRQVLHSFHLALWMMHLGDVSTKIVEFGVTKMFSVSPSTSTSTSTQQCNGLLLGLGADYTARKMLDKNVIDSLLSSSSSSSNNHSGDEICLDSLCLNCARPVREHDAFFKKFLKKTKNKKNTNKDDPLDATTMMMSGMHSVASFRNFDDDDNNDEMNNNNNNNPSSATDANQQDLELFLEALCLFGNYAWDSHPMTEYLHGNEKCLAEHLPHYLDMPHSLSPGMIANTLASVEERTSGTNSKNSNNNTKQQILSANSANVMRQREEMLNDDDTSADDDSSSSASSDNDEDGNSSSSSSSFSETEDLEGRRVLSKGQQRRLAAQKRKERRRQKELLRKSAPETDRICREELQLREEIHAQHMIVSLANGFVGGVNDPIHATGCACCASTSRDAQKLIHSLLKKKLSSSTTSKNGCLLPETEKEYHQQQRHQQQQRVGAGKEKDYDLRCFLRQSSSAKELLKMRQEEMMKIVQKVRDACVFEDTLKK